MSIELNHTIVGATDAHASARFLAGILGLAIGADAGHFVPVRLANGVTLDYMNRSRVAPQHYAFLVSDDDFDAAFARIREGGLTYFADPGFQQPSEINTRWGGRGVYFHDPDDHSMELLTRAP
jgi:catechol 2,3-dioxygenase-like lactoylglutathione lyase family enzyme